MSNDSVNVIYTGYQEYTFHLAKHLKREFNYQPVYWTHSEEIEPLIRQEFRDVILHNIFDSLKGRPAKEIDEDHLESIDEALLTDLAYYESIAMNLMNRMDLTHSFSYTERRDHYQYLLKYWKTVIHKLKPEIIFFEEVPHAINTFTLYILAKHYGIKTYLFERTAFLQQMYLLEDYEKGHEYIIRYYKKLVDKYDKEGVQFQEAVERKLALTRGSYNEGKPYYTGSQEKEISKSSRTPSQVIMGYVSHYIKIFNIAKLKKRYDAVMGLFKPEYTNDIKEEHKTIRESNITKWSKRKYLKQVKKDKHKLLDYYNSIIDHDIDLKQPYIFCALHYQPERATCPSGGVYVNQMLMIEQLLATLPEGWFLYIKDHIAQFISYTHSEVYRSTAFYDQLKRNPKIRLVPLKYDAFSMIDHSKAVVTITGTIGWEALVREKPVLYFGLPWYVGCEGAFDVRTEEKLRQAIDQIKNGYKVSYAKVRAYLKCIEDLGHKGAVGGPGYCKVAGVEQEENGQYHFDAFKKYKTLISA